MIDVIKKINFGNSGDYVKVTVDSIENYAILLGNDSINTNAFVIFKQDVDVLIEALNNLKDNYF